MNENKREKSSMRDFRNENNRDKRVGVNGKARQNNYRCVQMCEREQK